MAVQSKAVSPVQDSRAVTLYAQTDRENSTSYPVQIDSNGALKVNPSSEPTNIEGGGKVSVGLTAVEVTFTGATSSIIITADKDNTGTLYVGKSTVTSIGTNALTFLESGDAITLDYNDATNSIYVVASVASQNFWKGAVL